MEGALISFAMRASFLNPSPSCQLHLARCPPTSCAIWKELAGQGHISAPHFMFLLCRQVAGPLNCSVFSWCKDSRGASVTLPFLAARSPEGRGCPRHIH